MADLRLRLIEMLTFPRVLAADAIDTDNCPHGKRFDASDECCLECRYGAECEWLESSEPFVDLTARPPQVLVDSLRHAVAYVDANSHRAGRKISACTCRSCEWLRGARQLLREFDGTAVLAGTHR